MNENALEVLEQYDLEVLRTWKGREVYFCETDKGIYRLKEQRGSEEKIERICQLLKTLEKVQFFKTDFPVKNKEEKFLVKDSDEISYLLKAWKDGRECDPRSELDVCRSMEGLAILHTHAKGIWTFASETEREKCEGINLITEMEKRNRELKKVQSFIRKKQRKNDFESCYL